MRTAPASIDDAEFMRSRHNACPGAGACGGQFTANTMAMVLTALGLSPLGFNDIPATHPAKPAPRALRRTRDGVPEDTTARRATC